ncbi:Branched-chain amino acid ABC-type transport system, permease component [Desulfosarcina cetonica]|uniref:branched-chain amino acid ABC transporter permease n=1 Tax=Desulfosarcina cetonica TaxID=90730 RepID=UPI0006CFD8BF|nr:branched-chain amino acid ABC transporter permease [Desulfosarcina cetonica]VTR65709.1 Branched-chain amino acid ABC-type transport system, permease component [Desulfosarcina cetonica]
MIAGTLIYATINSVALALTAMGFNLTFGISRVANFAYGAFYVLAAYAAWLLIHRMGVPYPLAVVITITACTAIGALLYRLVLIRIHGQPLSEVIVTFGIGLAILELLRTCGMDGFDYTLPLMVDRVIVVAGTPVDMQRMLSVPIGLLVMLLLWGFTRHTALGRAFRGMAQDPRTAMTFGIDPDKMAMLAVALGSGLAAVAAMVIAPLGGITLADGYDVLLKVLAVCIIGGLGSTGGAILASFILGFAERFTDVFIGSKWTMIVSLATILVVLVVRPSGLFGRQKALQERI